MWYNVEVKKVAILLLPTFLRKPKIVAYLQALLNPFDAIYYQWKNSRTENIYRLEHTGQVCRLRKVLNDKLDPQLRRIYIGNGDRYRRTYLYIAAEEKPKYLGKLVLYPSTDFEDTGVDFIVYTPKEIVNTQIHELRSLIDFYRLAPKRYKIEPI